MSDFSAFAAFFIAEMIRYYITDHQTESLYRISHEHCETREDRSSSSGYSFFLGEGEKRVRKFSDLLVKPPEEEKKKKENLFVISSHSGQKDDEKAGNRNESGSPPSWTKRQERIQSREVLGSFPLPRTSGSSTAKNHLCRQGTGEYPPRVHPSTRGTGWK